MLKKPMLKKIELTTAIYDSSENVERTDDDDHMFMSSFLKWLLSSLLQMTGFKLLLLTASVQ